MTLVARTQSLQRAAVQWEDRAEQLHGARATLDDADPALLGTRVADAARAFLETWRREVGRLRAEADDHATALRGAASDTDLADARSRDDMRRLMAWPDRGTTPDGGVM